MNPKTLLLQQIINCSLEFFDLTIEELKTPCRKRDFVETRAMIMMAIKKYIPTLTQETIAKIFDRDHTTFIHAEKILPTMLKHNDILAKTFNSYIEHLEERLFTGWIRLTQKGDLCFSLDISKKGFWSI